MVRRQSVEYVGGFEESVHYSYEDQPFYAKLCLNAPIFVSNECWDRYRQHSDSSVAVVNKNRQQYAARLSFLNWLARYLADQGIKDRTIWNALQKQRWIYRYSLPPRLLDGKNEFRR